MSQNYQEMRAKYLRWSIPSIVLAIVSVLFAIASIWAQRHVQSRYEALVARYMTATLESDPPWTIDLMRRASIAAKRLVVEDLESAEKARNFALVDIHSHKELVRYLSAQDVSLGNESQSHLIELAKTTQQRAIDSMRRAARLEGAAGTKARLWMLDWQFREEQIGSLVSESRFQEWQSSCEDMLHLGDDAKLLLADLLIHRALLNTSSGNASSADQRLQEAIEHLVSIDEISIEREASLIEAMAFSNPAKAKNESLKAISTFRQLSPKTSASWRERDAMFRIRLGLGNAQESFDFAWNSLLEIAPLDRDVFRWCVASSALRCMKANLLVSGPQFEKNASQLFGFAFRYAPDSGQIKALIEALVLDEQSAIANDLRNVLEQGHDASVRDLLEWLRQCGSRSAGADFPSPPETLKDDPLLAPGSLLTMLLLRKNGDLDDRGMLGLLDRLVQIWGGNIELHSWRSDLALQMEEYPMALDSLMKLREQFPKEPRIAGLLKDVETRMNKSNVAPQRANEKAP